MPWARKASAFASRREDREAIVNIFMPHTRPCCQAPPRNRYRRHRLCALAHGYIVGHAPGMTTRGTAYFPEHVRHDCLNTPAGWMAPQRRWPVAPPNRLTGRDRRSGNARDPRRRQSRDRRGAHPSIGAGGGPVAPSRRGSRRGPHPTPDDNRLTETSGRGADERDG